ncbi:MAG TPA: 2-phospho-L-lactate transferase [Levilinea sp.]|nr:2-phospho-L-lactate transferase [Levilinea sp.]
MKISALAGGVGGAKLAAGLQDRLGPGELSVVVNTGDDFTHLGLRICPDLDTVCYTLAGISNPETGWGRAMESFRAMAEIERLGGPTWFRLGDLDLATHLERTRRLKDGEPLSQVSAALCERWGVRARVLPMSDQETPTIVRTREQGELPFQDYFVRLRCEPQVAGFHFAGMDTAEAAPGVLEAIRAADAVIICPSNPWVSIAPILAVPGVREALHQKIILAVSPIIGGRAIKGPAAKMYTELGIEPSAQAVAQGYGSLLSGFVIDVVDAGQAAALEAAGIKTLVTQTVMASAPERTQLAAVILDWLKSEWL